MSAALSHRRAARIATPLAHRYLNQLCRHFQHRMAVTLGEHAGRIAFPDGLCRIRADQGVLDIEVVAADPETGRQIQDVIARHLLRFAFRNPPEILWREAGGRTVPPPAPDAPTEPRGSIRPC